MINKAPLPSVRRFLRRDKRLLIFGFFLLISATLWLLNKLSHSYTHDIKATAVLTIPSSSGFMITNGEEAEIQLSVRARGYDLMQYNALYSKNIDVNLGQFRLNNINNKGESSLLTSQLRNSVAQQLGSSFELQGISPDTIHFQLARVTSKKVPVVVDFNISYAPQYKQQGSPIVQPDSIIISGAKADIDKVVEIKTKPLRKEKVQESLSGKIALNIPALVFASHDKVSYSINIQRFAQISKEVPIHLIGAPDSLDVELLPAKATVSFSIAMEEYNKHKHDELYLMAYYSELAESISGEIRVHLSNPPEYVLSTSITPAFVNVIVRQKP